MLDLLIKNGKVVIPEFGERDASIGVKDGKIVAILAPGDGSQATREIDAKGKYVIPGGIDPHSHFGYPTLKTFDPVMDTETKCAALGGISTVVLFWRQYGMLPSPYENFWEVIKKAEANSYIDFGVSLMISVKSQATPEAYKKYITDFGVKSFKYSMAYKGTEGSALGITNEVDDAFLYDSFCQIAKYPGAKVSVHCENIEIINMLTAEIKKAGRQDLQAYTESRPDFCEAESVRRVLYIAQQANCPTYVVHVTAKSVLDEIVEHRKRTDVPVFVETCPQYLTLTKDSPVGVPGKVNPPLREQKDIDGLWAGITNGSVNTIGTDHCHLTMAQKKELWSAVPGFPGYGVSLALLLSEGVNKGRINMQTLAKVFSTNAAQIFGIYPQKGTIQVGSDADFAIVDLNLEKKVNHKDLLGLSDFSLWDGWNLKGWPVMTIQRGVVIMENGQIIGKKGVGKYIKR